MKVNTLYNTFLGALGRENRRIRNGTLLGISSSLISVTEQDKEQTVAHYTSYSTLVRVNIDMIINVWAPSVHMLQGVYPGTM